MSRAKNPVRESARSKLRKATQLYEDFRDDEASEVLEMQAPDFTHGLIVGKLSAIEYDTIRGGKKEKYRHKFKAKAMPLLCVTPDGKNAFTVLGDYQFTERGFEDFKH